jgi:hypothetical protein
MGPGKLVVEEHDQKSGGESQRLCEKDSIHREESCPIRQEGRQGSHENDDEAEVMIVRS